MCRAKNPNTGDAETGKAQEFICSIASYGEKFMFSCTAWFQIEFMYKRNITTNIIPVHVLIHLFQIIFFMDANAAYIPHDNITAQIFNFWWTFCDWQHIDFVWNIKKKFQCYQFLILMEGVKWNSDFLELLFLQVTDKIKYDDNYRRESWFGEVA